MKKEIYKVYEDAGHSWMKVLKSELKNLCIDMVISGFSYQDGDYAYLEEDCDAQKFIEAKKNIGIEIEGNFIYSGDYSNIRNFKSYDGGVKR